MANWDANNEFFDEMRRYFPGFGGAGRQTTFGYYYAGSDDRAYTRQQGRTTVLASGAVLLPGVLCYCGHEPVDHRTYRIGGDDGTGEHCNGCEVYGKPPCTGYVDDPKTVVLEGELWVGTASNLPARRG